MKLTSNLRGDIFGGLTASIVSLPLSIAFGVAAFAPLGPEYVAQGALAGLYAKQGRHEEARALLERAGSRQPEDVNLRYNRAVILQNDGRIEEAASIYVSILDVAPSHEGALINLGVIYARQGRAERARQLWLRALEVNPANRNAKRNLELLEDRTGN